MPNRPTDVPSAMREAFEGHRTISAWNLVVSAPANERLAALLGFERLLMAQGLGLADIATAIASLPRSKTNDRSTEVVERSSSFAGFGGAFSKDDMPTGHAPRPTEVDPTRKAFRDVSVPENVIGRIRVAERRPTRGNGEMLVFTAETAEAVYGPMAAFAGPQIAHLLEAERSNWIIRLLVERTQSERILPKVRRLETV